MKKITFIGLVLIIAMLIPLTKTDAKSVECPNPSDLVTTNLKDKKELLQALETIIPETYDQEDNAELFAEWKVITAKPFPWTVGDENNEVYYQIASNLCGKEVASKSWLVKLYFPKLADISASLSQGQIFMAKDKQNEWFIWFRYH